MSWLKRHEVRRVALSFALAFAVLSVRAQVDWMGARHDPASPRSLAALLVLCYLAAFWLRRLRDTE
jgi:hypothetical protein